MTWYRRRQTGVPGAGTALFRAASQPLARLGGGPVWVLVYAFSNPLANSHIVTLNRTWCWMIRVMLNNFFTILLPSISEVFLREGSGGGRHRNLSFERLSLQLVTPGRRTFHSIVS
jgi:hypothetical protein